MCGSGGLLGRLPPPKSTRTVTLFPYTTPVRPPLPAVPALRPRRLRDRDWTRRLVAEIRLGIDDLIWPSFVHDGSGSAPMPSMPGVERLSIDAAEIGKSTRLSSSH